jgi:2-phosphoglycerate kinase
MRVAESASEYELVLTVAASTTFIVTIDGPAGTGKSTVAHRLAKRACEA